MSPRSRDRRHLCTLTQFALGAFLWGAAAGLVPGPIAEIATRKDSSQRFDLKGKV